MNNNDMEGAVRSRCREQSAVATGGSSNILGMRLVNSRLGGLYSRSPKLSLSSPSAPSIEISSSQAPQQPLLQRSSLHCHGSVFAAEGVHFGETGFAHDLLDFQICDVSWNALRFG